MKTQKEIALIVPVSWLVCASIAVATWAGFDPAMTSEQVEQAARTMTESEKQAMCTRPEDIQSLEAPVLMEASGAGLLYPLPADRTPDDGNDLNDDGWRLVDFCTAGQTGSGAAMPPECHANDDDSAVLELPFTFLLYGTPWDAVYINNNGNLSFGSLYSSFTASGFPEPGFPMVAGFWADVDTRTNLGHVWYKFVPGRNTLVVTWDSVGYYPGKGDKRNTFQIAISDGTDPDLGLGNNVCLSYGDMQWTTGSASDGIGGFGGTPATVGVNSGNGVDFAQIGRFDHEGIDYDGPGGAADGVSYLDGQTFFLNVSGTTNVPPVPVGFPSAGRFVVQGGTPLSAVVYFASPELGQITTVTIEDVNGMQARGLVLSNTPGNPAEITLSWTPTCADGGTYELRMTAVDDGMPPLSTVVSLYIDVVCPIHVVAGGPYYGSEGTAVAFDASASTGAGILVYDWNWGDGEMSLDAGPMPTHTYLDDGTYTVTLTVSVLGKALSDTDTTTAEIANVAPVVGPLVIDRNPAPVRTRLTAAASFSDAGVLDTHTAMCDWGDGDPEHAGTVLEANGSGEATASTQEADHTDYALPGIYPVSLTVTDKDGDSGCSNEVMVVIYDPAAGFVTGGGWINSPAGAYRPNPAASGKANFGFVSKYLKDRTVPTGQTEFRFRAGSINFHSETFEWLVVNRRARTAQFKGTGTVNGAGGYHFMVWACDGLPDTFRIRIWRQGPGGEIEVYDNGANRPVDGGSIVVHTGNRG